MSKPRFAARVDETQPAIKEALELAGAKVEVLDVHKAGVPDFLVGWLGTLTLMENKSKGGRLSAEQEAEHAAWARVGVKVVTCRTPREALDAIGVTGERAEANLAAMRLLVSERRRVAKVEGKLVSSVRRPA